jgi:hypothetical protein
VSGVKHAVLAVFAISVGATALAGDQDTEDALSLADKTTMVAEKAGAWKTFVEGAAGESTLQGSGAHQHGERLSFDAHGDLSFAPGWRAVLADRVDFGRLSGASAPNASTGDNNINTLKEAYVSWQLQPDRIADLGRINVRNGVGFGYNPTDVFRAYAVRSIVSIDPASLRENRQGSIMARGQALWDQGSLTALYSPKLADHPNNAGFSPDVGATNGSDRWQLALSQKLVGDFAPQWLVTGGSGQSAQAGVNATTLINNKTIAYLEWQGGRSPTQLSQALAAQGVITPTNMAFHSRLASGLTYTTENNVSLTFEYERNNAAPDDVSWQTLRSGSPLVYGAYRTYLGNVLDIPSRQNLFAYATWTDAMIQHLDLTAMVRYDIADYSHLHWFEARYHWTRTETALQWQRNIGHAASDYGALPQQTVWEVVVRYFF